MKIAIFSLIILLVITSVLTICLVTRCSNQSQIIFDLKKGNDTLKAELETAQKVNDKLYKKTKEIDELNNIPVTVIKEVIVNPKIQTLCVKKIITAEMSQFGGEDYKKLAEKQMAQELLETLMLNGFIEYITEKDALRMEEVITAILKVVRR